MLHKFNTDEYHCKHCMLHIREIEPNSHCPELPIDNPTDWMKESIEDKSTIDNRYNDTGTSLN